MEDRVFQEQCYCPLESLNIQGNTYGMFGDGFPTGVCCGKTIFCLVRNHVQISAYSLWCEFLIIIVALHSHPNSSHRKQQMSTLASTADRIYSIHCI